ncbi:MAG: hypothetical protein ACTHON_03140 [Humibacter sp.]
MDDRRRRLLERAYSREGASEDVREYRDPVTGETVRMTPSEWALAEYDREHAPTSTDDGPAGAPRPDRNDGGMPAPGDDEGPQWAAVPGADASLDDSRHERPTRRGILPTLLVGVAAFIVGVLATLGVSAAVGGPSASSHPEPTPVSSRAVPFYVPLPAAAVDEYFHSPRIVGDLPNAVTAGFDPSFYPVANSLTLQESSAIYAARRLNGEYCLVAVAGDERVAETCTTLSGIAKHGLSLTKDVTRDLDGRPLAVTATWQKDGTISWDAMPSVG